MTYKQNKNIGFPAVFLLLSNFIVFAADTDPWNDEQWRVFFATEANSPTTSCLLENCSEPSQPEEQLFAELSEEATTQDDCETLKDILNNIRELFEPGQNSLNSANIESSTETSRLCTLTHNLYKFTTTTEQTSKRQRVSDTFYPAEPPQHTLSEVNLTEFTQKSEQEHSEQASPNKLSHSTISCPTGNNPTNTELQPDSSSAQLFQFFAEKALAGSKINLFRKWAQEENAYKKSLASKPTDNALRGKLQSAAREKYAANCGELYPQKLTKLTKKSKTKDSLKWHCVGFNQATEQSKSNKSTYRVILCPEGNCQFKTASPESFKKHMRNRHYEPKKRPQSMGIKNLLSTDINSSEKLQ